ncbi:GNAT family N-acetyltransferase [Alsobacter sp. KACC 23698]|uniref:GNAT family N-acetyltransferase n=2 Tax=Alsobacter sp. KACC 23698 TaxID=3149229 RepID=A0AAU7JL95_9HYPH
MTLTTELALETYKMRIGDIRDVALGRLHALSMAVRWPHREADWEMLLGFGHGLAASDEIGRVLSTAMWFTHGEDFATMGMLITSPRLQTHGAGRWLMEHVIAQTAPRRLGLNATRAAQPLYRSMGFKDEATVYQCQGEARLTADVKPRGMLRPIAPADMDAIAALDRVAFGADRRRLLDLLAGMSQGLVLERDGAVVGYGLCRPFGRGYVVGPLVATTDEDAVALAAPHIAAHAGSFVRLDTRSEAGPFAELLVRAGLPVFDTVTTMSLASSPWLPVAPSAGAPRIYALASHALS